MKKEDQKRILIIEDDADVLATIVQHLELSGYAVDTATDGMDGLKKLKSSRYDLVITDFVMPYVSGAGVVTTLKENEPQTPVIAITGYGKEPETVAMEKKADLVLSKPVKMSDLKDHIVRLLNPSEKEKSQT